MEPSSIFIPSTRDSMELLYDWRLPFIKGEESLRWLRLTYGFVLSSPGSPIAGVALAFLCQIVLRATLDHIQPLFSLLALTVYCKTSSASQNFPLFLGISRCLMFANEKFFLLWSECLCFPKFLWWIPMPTSPPHTHRSMSWYWEDRASGEWLGQKLRALINKSLCKKRCLIPSTTCIVVKIQPSIGNKPHQTPNLSAPSFWISHLRIVGNKVLFFKSHQTYGILP
jgi:hypothetical protein